MTKDTERAARLKDEGNAYFTSGNFLAAESLYSKALVSPAALLRRMSIFTVVDYHHWSRVYNPRLASSG